MEPGPVVAGVADRRRGARRHRGRDHRRAVHALQRRRAVRLRRLVLVTASMAAVAVPAGDAAAAADVVVSVDRPATTTELGRRFVLRSTISNRGTAAATGLIAHLNVLSLRRGVYVEPEDWSSDRTRYLAPIGAGRSIALTWNLQAVNAGT